MGSIEARIPQRSIVAIRRIYAISRCDLAVLPLVVIDMAVKPGL